MNNVLSEARLPLTDHPDDPEAARILDGVRSRTGRVLNLHRVFAYAPKLMQAQFDLVMALRFELTLSRDLVELCILRTAQLCHSDYEWHQHLPMALQTGLSQAKIDALAGWHASSAFDDGERSALLFTESVVSGSTLDTTAFATLRQHYSGRELVELAQLVSQYLATARIISAFAIPIEAPRGAAS